MIIYTLYLNLYVKYFNNDSINMPIKVTYNQINFIIYCECNVVSATVHELNCIVQLENPKRNPTPFK